MSEESQIHPIVIDLGKVRRKRIKALKRGRGRLLEEVRAAVDEVRARLGDDAKDREFVPVVLCYRQKRRRKKRQRDLLRGFLPFPV